MHSMKRVFLTFRMFKNQIKGFSETSEYQKKCFQFEENWKAISDEKNTELTRTLEEELTLDQKNYIATLAKAFANLNIYEIEYFYSETLKYNETVKGVPFMSLIVDWPTVKKGPDGRYPVADATWFLQQEKLAEMWPGGIKEFSALFSNMNGSGSQMGSAGNLEAEASKKTDEEPKEEVVAQEQTSFEVELTAFDPPQKIKIIKEIRQMMNLGLKDAKDLVEKAPVSLKKDVKKEEAEAMKERLTAAGCTVNLK